jgi:hypothetical protein
VFVRACLGPYVGALAQALSTSRHLPVHESACKSRPEGESLLFKSLSWLKRLKRLKQEMCEDAENIGAYLRLVFTLQWFNRKLDTFWFLNCYDVKMLPQNKGTIEFINY